MGVGFWVGTNANLAGREDSTGIWSAWTYCPWSVSLVLIPVLINRALWHQALVLWLLFHDLLSTTLRADFHVLVIGSQKQGAPPKWLKQTELKSIFFISNEMGGVSVNVGTSFLVFYCLSPNWSWHGSPPNKKRGLKSYQYSIYFGANEKDSPEFCLFHPFQWSF